MFSKHILMKLKKCKENVLRNFILFLLFSNCYMPLPHKLTRCVTSALYATWFYCKETYFLCVILLFLFYYFENIICLLHVNVVGWLLAWQFGWKPSDVQQCNMKLSTYCSKVDSYYRSSCSFFFFFSFFVADDDIFWTASNLHSMLVLYVRLF